mgnify:CR=1 FL=1
MEVVSAAGTAFDLFVSVASGISKLFKFLFARREKISIEPVRHGSGDDSYSADVIIRRLHISTDEYRVRFFTNRNISQRIQFHALVASRIVQTLLSLIKEEKLITKAKLKKWSKCLKEYIENSNQRQNFRIDLDKANKILDITLTATGEAVVFAGIEPPAADFTAAGIVPPAETQITQTIQQMLRIYAPPRTG